MPRYEITAPDGKRYEVTAPEGASQDQVMQYFKASYQQPQQPAETFDPTEGMSGYEKTMAGMGKSFVDLYRGAKQRFGLMSDEDVAEARRLDAPLMETTEGTVGNILGGAAAMMLPGGAALNTYKGAAATGALLGAMQPTVEGESAMANTLMGGGSAAAGKLVADAIGGLIRPSRAPSTAQKEAEQTLLRHGVEVRNPQMGSEAIQRVDKVLDAIPITSARNQAAKERQRKQFNAAVLRTMGGEGDEISIPALEAVRNRLSGEYDRFLSGAGAGVVRYGERDAGRVIRVDDKFLKELESIGKRYQNQMPSLQNSQVGNLLSDLGQVIQPFRSGAKPAFTREQYQAQLSGLSNLSRKLFQKEGDADAAIVADSIKKAFDDLLERNIPQKELAEFRRLRRQYANFKTVEKAVNRRLAGRAEGSVSPTDLYNTIKSRSKSDAFRATTELSKLAHAGEKFIKETSSSGTAENLMLMQMMQNPLSLIGGGASIVSGDPTYALGGMAAAASPVMFQQMLNNPAMRNYLTGQMIPETAVMGALGSGGRAAVPALATGGILNWQQQ